MGPPPWNGTVTKSRPRASLSISIDSDGVVPVPGDPTLCLPGSRLIRSINSFIVCTGKFELTTHEFGVAPALVTGMKVLVNVVGHLVVKAWVDDDARRRQQDGIAVARRAGRIRHADIAAG